MIHGGNLFQYKKMSSQKEILDFSANINPLGFPDWLRLEINSSLGELAHYPDWNYESFKETIAKYHGVHKEEVAVYNGISEALMILPRALEIQSATICDPGFEEYERGLKAFRSQIHRLKLNQFNFASLELEGSAFYVGHPHNPTGKCLPKDFSEVILKNKKKIFIIDEAFLDFTSEESFLGVSDNLIILKSLTKILCIPGLRLGYSIQKREWTKKIEEQLPFWNVNSLSAHLGTIFFEKGEEFLKETRELLNTVKEIWKKHIKGLPLKIHESAANFFLLECLNQDAKKLWKTLLKEKGIALRSTDSFMNMDPHRFLRVAIRNERETLILIEALKDFYGVKIQRKKKTPSLMLQGTTSNAGKSILTTAICRILYQDGLKVFPFKSQNMALNSFVTKDGGEIGRAQAVQAQACGQDPSILMNPILLKPNCDIGSQVIIHGRPISHMNFRDYFKFKPKAFTEVKKAYDEIASFADVMVIEGAGSPSEVNLKQNDIVNMNMARYAGADVYITSDIDRGGMFASFLGTFDTLSEWERSLVKGLIINRFRGDKSLLDSGMDYLKHYTHVPVIGCVPYIKGHNIPEEDCLEFKSGMLDDRSELGERLDIAVIDTPRISNFSDLDALKEEPDIRLRIVRDAKGFGNPDMLLLCGSKSVMRDLEYLKESGLASKILNFHYGNKGLIVGICGGYQMLGKSILDPNHVESDIEFMEGLGLLDIETTLEEEKLLGQTKTSFIPFNQKLIGYEIHHGKTKPLSSSVKEVVSGGIGFSNLNGSVWGSYLHGVFDEDLFRRDFIDHLRILKGKEPLKKVVGQYSIERSIDRLASIVRESLDMDLIYKNLGL